MRHHRRLALVAAFAVALSAAIVATRADGKVDPRTYSVKSKVFGRTFPQWAAQWLQWSQSIPAAVNPLLDETGERASVGQRGPVWFLVGVENTSGIVNRVVKVPAGKALFFPFTNFFIYNYEDDPAPFTEAYMLDFAVEQLATVNTASLHVVLDGSDVQGVSKMRVFSRFSDMTMPADNVPVATGQDVPGGAHGPVMTDGYWCMLKPLRVGHHTLHFELTLNPPNNFRLDINYDITVVDHSFPKAGN